MSWTPKQKATAIGCVVVLVAAGVCFAYVVYVGFYWVFIPNSRQYTNGDVQVTGHIDHRRNVKYLNLSIFNSYSPRSLADTPVYLRSESLGPVLFHELDNETLERIATKVEERQGGGFEFHIGPWLFFTDESGIDGLYVGPVMLGESVSISRDGKDWREFPWDQQDIETIFGSDGKNMDYTTH